MQAWLGGLGPCCSSQPVALESEQVTDVVINAIPVNVAIVAAQGLRQSDWLPNGSCTSNCYCIVTTKRGVAHRELGRTTSMSSLEPVWKQEMQLLDVSAADVLEFAVYDEDLNGKAPCLGKGSLAVSGFLKDGFVGELPLYGGGQGAFLYLKARCQAHYPRVYPDLEVTVSRSADDGSWGLDLDFQDATILWVNRVNPGPVERYNRHAGHESQLRSGDFIVSANGVHSNAEKLLAQFQAETTVVMLVARPMEIRAVIETDGSGSTAGLELPVNPSGNCLLIREVNSGPAEKWNAAQAEPSAQLRPGDRIVSVNGQRGGAADLQRLLAAPGRCQVLALRAADSSHWRFW